MADRFLGRVNDIVSEANNDESRIDRSLSDDDRATIEDLLDRRAVENDGCLVWVIPAFALSTLLLRFLARG